jgi:hypothetical protein
LNWMRRPSLNSMGPVSPFSSTWNHTDVRYEKQSYTRSLAMWMRMLAYRSRKEIPISRKPRMLIPWEQEKISGRLRLRRSVLSSSSAEGGSCSSETKHRKRTTPRPKLFVSSRRLQEQRLQVRKKMSWVRVSINIFSAFRKLIMKQ